jgi:GTP-binding protein
MDYETINRELQFFNPQLIQKPQIVVLNKIDLPGTATAAAALIDALDDQVVISISALKKTGIDKLISRILQLLERTDDEEPKI